MSDSGNDPLEPFGHRSERYVRPNDAYTPQGASLRKKRSWLILWTTVVALALIGLILSLPQSVQLLDPGPLSSAHATSTLGDCSLCHNAAALSEGHWLQADAATDSLRCLDCHDQGDHPQSPHGFSPAALAAAQPSVTNRNTWVEWLQGGLPKKLECAGCHIEHQGQGHMLKVMADADCNRCHQQDVDSFPAGHPDFSDAFMGYEHAAIHFNHASHFGTHFAGNEAASMMRCASCHVPESAGRMKTLPFETSCASCHQHTRQIEGSLATLGRSILHVPGIDTASLAKAGFELPFWTVSRRQGEGTLSPVMSMLLAGADVYPAPDYPLDHASSWARDEDLLLLLPSGLRDLRKASPEQAAAVHRSAWAVRYLFAELAEQEGLNGLQQRLQRVVNRSLSHEELADLTGQLPLDVIRRMRENYFPLSPKEEAAP